MAKSNISQTQLDAYAKHIKQDYINWWGKRGEDETVQSMIAEFEIGFEIGSSYIKAVKIRKGVVDSVHSFICNKDGKFPKGAVLKAASFKAPATNFLRAWIDKPETWAGRVVWTGTH